MIETLRNRFAQSLFCLILVGMFTPSFAAIPAGYYDSATGKRGEQLEVALRDIIDGHHDLGYDNAKDALWSNVDNRGGYVECIYTGRQSTSLVRDTDSMNTEHSWPQSRGAGSSPRRNDLHHLFITDSGWNSRRGSYRFTEVTNPSAVSAIGAQYNSSQGFEPPDQNKGDIARAILYFHVRYDYPVMDGSTLSGSNGSTSDDNMGELGKLIEWHFADEVSTFEINRNDRIYGLQNNRNPFIDHPEFVTDLFELGPSAPVIALSTDPAIPMYDTATYLLATITSDEPVNASTAKVYWRLGSSGLFNTVSLSLESGSTTSGNWRSASGIPAQSNGTVVEYYAEAADTVGTLTREPFNGQLSYTSFEPGVPTIAASTNPSSPIVGDPILFLADIQSEAGVDDTTVKVEYTINSGTDQTISMSRASGTLLNGSWEADNIISGLQVGDTVRYAVVAEDVDGRLARNPSTGTFEFTVLEEPVEIDLSGYQLANTESGGEYSITFPEGTKLTPGAYLVVSRRIAKAEFETFWGVTLPEEAVFINSFDVIGGNGMVINGGEVFELRDVSTALVDGPAPDTSLDPKNAILNRVSTDVNSWTREEDSSLATPGTGSFEGHSAGLVMTEICDPDDGYEEAFVEIYYDASGSSSVGVTDCFVLH